MSALPGQRHLRSRALQARPPLVLSADEPALGIPARRDEAEYHRSLAKPPQLRSLASPRTARPSSARLGLAPEACETLLCHSRRLASFPVERLTRQPALYRVVA